VKQAEVSVDELRAGRRAATAAKEAEAAALETASKLTGEAERRRFMGQRPKPDAKFCRNETEKAVAYENAGLIARRCGSSLRLGARALAARQAHG
jgi:hypothetical protein